MKRLMLPFLLGVSLIPAALAGPQKEREIQTGFGPIVTKTRDVGLLNLLKTGPDGKRIATARIQLVWPGEVFGRSSEQRKNLQKQAAVWAAKECDLLLKTLASECHLAMANADVWTNSATLVLNLDFVPMDSFPASPASETRRLKALDLDYDNDTKSPGLDVEAAAAERTRIYTQIRRDCRETREAFGNCVLYGIHLNSSLMGPADHHIIRVTCKSYFAAIWQQQEIK
jgi:hypothetical protein